MHYMRWFMLKSLAQKQGRSGINFSLGAASSHSYKKSLCSYSKTNLIYANVRMTSVRKIDSLLSLYQIM